MCECKRGKVKVTWQTSKVFSVKCLQAIFSKRLNLDVVPVLIVKCVCAGHDSCHYDFFP
jgi:hypothetical protein